MQITKEQFDIMTTILEYKEMDTNLTQRYLSENLGISLGKANKVMSELFNLKIIELDSFKNYAITSYGLELLEPYKVKRAIFIAAGFGSRLVPITLNTPKPLVRVKGKRIIETLLDAVVDVGIKEIYIVRGYLKNQFDELLIKYPNIKFYDNDEFNISNNITSLNLVKDKICNSYILDSDLYLTNPKLIRKYEYSTHYLGISTDRSDDWCLKLKNGKITSMELGGLNSPLMVGISFWTKDDGIKLAYDIDEVL